MNVPVATPRVLMVSARFPPYTGGIETHIREVTTRLAERGVRVEVLTTDRGGSLPQSEWADGYHIRRVRAYPSSRDYHIAPAILPAVLRGKFDILHLQGIHTMVAPFAMGAAVAARRPFVVTFHTGGHRSAIRNRLRGVQWRLLSPLLRRARALIAVSEFERAMIAGATGLDQSRIQVIRNGAGMPMLQGDAPAEDRDLVISVGRLERYKGHHRAIAALPHLVQRRPGARLLILGDGPERASLERLARRLNVSDRVAIRAIPAADRVAMARTLRAAHLVVLLSDYEAHPVAVAEARALGRRVLVADTTGLAELAADGQASAVPLNAAPHRIAERMDEVMAQAPPIAGALPSWDACVDLLLEVYQRSNRPRVGPSPGHRARFPVSS
jgi:glycosyltransferase involved in cell wall biosynthesis